MKIKTTIGYHLTHLLEWLSSKRQETNIGEDVLKGDLCTVVRMKIDAATTENSMKIPQKIKNTTAVWSSNPIPGYISKGNENRW